MNIKILGFHTNPHSLFEKSEAKTLNRRRITIGTLAVIFFEDKNERPSRVQLLKDCRDICLENNLDFILSPYIKGFNIASRSDYSQQLIVSVRDKTDDDYRTFEWHNDDERLYVGLWVENTRNSDDVLFPFVYPFFKRYPDAKLWIDWTDWFFTLSDLEEIALRYNDCKDNWYCKNPDGSEYYATLSYCIDGHNVIEKTVNSYSFWTDIQWVQYEAAKVITVPFAVDIAVENKGVMSVACTRDDGILSCYLAGEDTYFASLGDEQAKGETLCYFGDYSLMSNKYLVPQIKVYSAIKEWIKHGTLSNDIRWKV